MTYIIILLLSIIIIWSLIAYKEISVRASGVIRPRGEIKKISNGITGSIKEINIKEGCKVRKGDVLLVINESEYTLQRDLLQERLDKKNKALDSLRKLKESVLEGENKFNSNNKGEKEYYEKYELYLKGLNLNNNQKILYEKQKGEMSKYIDELELLKEIIKKEENYFNERSTLYYQYKDYEIGIRHYNDIIKEAQEKIKTLESTINEENKKQSNIDISNLKNSIQNTKREMEKFKNTSIINVTNQISQTKLQLSQMANTTGGSNYKEQYLSNVESNISNLESTIDDIKMNLELTNQKIRIANIKAPCDGIVNMLSEIKVGDFLQNGTQIASIVPENQSEFYVEVYIDTQNFAEIKDNQDVIIELVSLQGSEYGYIKSTLKNISVDAKVSAEKDGSYYSANCPIAESSLKNSNGNSVNIKNGMLAQVRIINRQISYFRYFMEKISILD